MKQHSAYSVIVSPAEEGGFTVTVPALVGCVTEGDTLEEAMENAREAITLTLEALEAHGEPIPHELAPSFTSVISVPGLQYA